MEILPFLFFDVLLDEFVGDGTAGDGAVPSRPEVPSPEDFGQMGVVAEKCVGALALDVLHYVADGEFWRIGDEEVDVIRGDLPGEDVDINLGAEPTYKISHRLSKLTSEHPLPVFGYPDEMHLQIVFGVAAGVIRPHHGSNSSAAYLGSEGPPKGGGLYLPPCCNNDK